MPVKTNGFGLVHAYWGSGKGKTTAALGTALRALGHGFNVHIVQFMKAGLEGNRSFDECGELMALKKFKNFSFKKFGLKKWVIGTPEKGHLDEAQKALAHCKKILSPGKHDLVILDEILYAVQLKLLSEEDVLELIECKSPGTELILTGSHVPLESIFARADLVSEMMKMKHPFDSGIVARKGIDF
ncbi:ATP:corrinoid adenosyltransferase BtuR/CobO/CobP [uncultured archaeon]|nr:ATP:corrinoid adenosyltransferase BtuR/CobO/CobP [uncultured archaeon]